MKVEVVCPNCHSNQIKAHQKGINSTISVLFGNDTGMLGSNEIVITCLLCATIFKPGEGLIKKTDENGLETFEKSLLVEKDQNLNKEKIEKNQRETAVLAIIVILLTLIGLVWANSM